MNNDGSFLDFFDIKFNVPCELFNIKVLIYFTIKQVNMFEKMIVGCF